MTSDLERELAFQMKAAGLPVPEREYRFAPPRRWRFDFAWPDRLVAVEVQGGTWVQGRHTRPKGFEVDCQKLCAAAVAGWRVLPLTGAMIEEGHALKVLEAVLLDRAVADHPANGVD